MKKILVMMTGGTIAQKVDSSGRMQIALSPSDLVKDINVDCNIETFSLDARAGANLTLETIKKIFLKTKESENQFDGFVLITGTDSMEEVAFFLDLIKPTSKPFVITGSMKPSDIIGYDGLSNLQQAVQVASNDLTGNFGVVVVMNDDIHAARYVRKHDSQLIGAFQSHPGPIGQLRRGRIYFYFSSLPDMEKFSDPKWEDIDLNIPILTMGIGLSIPETLMSEISGLVIAGMGTGSISEEMVDFLKPWTNRIPIVLSSRCPVGTSFDDAYYRGSKEKYESLGFKLSGYEDFNPIQARLLLALRLSM